MQRVSSSHSFGESAVHLQFTPKYRRPVFSNPLVLKATKGILAWIANDLGVTLVAAEGGPDHIHVFVTEIRAYAISELVRRFKGRAARELRRRFPDWLAPFRLGRSFWSDGYFYETVGSVTAEARQFYVERCQHKHWAGAPVADRAQRTVLAFTNVSGPPGL